MNGPRFVAAPVRVVLVGFLVSLSSAPALAQTLTHDAATAQALFDDGKRLVQNHQFAEACPKLLESQRLDPAGGTLVLLALCHEGEGKTATAWAEFNQALTEARKDKRSDREAAAAEHIRLLTPRLTRMQIAVGAESDALELRRDGSMVGRAQWSTPLPIDPGPHKLEASAPRKKPWSATIMVEGEGKTLTFSVPALEDDVKQNVAIKVMFPEHAENPILAARFAREAKLAAKLQSQHLVRVFDVGRLASGVPYLVMEMLSGRDLGAEIDARGALPIPEAADYMLQALVGIAEIHALGYVHRDLKPTNLFLAQVAGTSMVKILDFGISKEAAAQSLALTSTESILGTPSYMSPEQIKASKAADARSDIWALGVILYELLTAAAPYESEGNSVGKLFGCILFTDPIRPRRFRPDLPEALEEIVLRCMRREREDRYQNVLELAEAILPFAGSRSQHYVDAIHRVGMSAPHVSWSGSAARALAASGSAEAIGSLPTVRPPTSASVLGEPSSERPHARSLASSTRSVVQIEAPGARGRLFVFAIVLGLAGFLGIGAVLKLVTKGEPHTMAEATGSVAPPAASLAATSIAMIPPPQPAPHRPTSVAVVGANSSAAPPTPITRTPPVPARLPSTPSAHPVPSVTTGEGADPEQHGPGTRAKGGLALHVFRHVDDRSEEIVSGARLAPGERLRFVVDLPAAGHLAIVGVEATGNLYTAWPLAAGTPTFRNAGAGQELPGAAALDASKGREVLYLVHCPGAKDAPVCIRSTSGPPQCPSGCTLSAFVVEKGQ